MLADWIVFFYFTSAFSLACVCRFTRDKKSKLVRAVTRIFTNKFDGPYYTWSCVPRERKERYFFEFAVYFFCPLGFAYRFTCVVFTNIIIFSLFCRKPTHGIP